MGDITIRTMTADGMTVDGDTMVNGAAVDAGPPLQEPGHGHPQELRQDLKQDLKHELRQDFRKERGPEEAAPKEDRAEERVKVRPMPRVKTVRRSLGLTQEEFSARYGIPLGTLRDWEQGRTEPDQPARAYIRVIANNPDWVSRALAAEPQ
jgi:putative transcriptional regulator